MATVEQQPGAAQNGAGVDGQIAVENPATGETIAHVPAMDATQVVEIVGRARAAQPAWEALGFEGRAQVMRSMRKWLIHSLIYLLPTTRPSFAPCCDGAICRSPVLTIQYLRRDRRR